MRDEWVSEWLLTLSSPWSRCVPFTSLRNWFSLLARSDLWFKALPHLRLISSLQQCFYCFFLLPHPQSGRERDSVECIRFQAGCGKDLISSNMCTPIATAKDSQGSHTWYACFLVYQLFRIYILPPSISGYVLIFQSEDAFHSSIFPAHANKLCGEKRKYLFNNFALPTSRKPHRNISVNPSHNAS